MNLTVYIESLGCSKNLIDAEIMLGILNKYGYKLTTTKNNADIIIVNTCGFIDAAKEESINKIIELGMLKKKRLKLLLVSGCLGERYSEDLLKELPEVDAIIGTGNYHTIVETINESMKGNKIIQIGNIDQAFDESLPRFQTTPSHTAYVKISDGCDNVCTYCIIPKLRGKYRSRKMENIIKEVEDLANKGVKEIILIAQDTTRYGVDIYDELMLPRLLEKLNEVDGIHWIRLLYAYPEMITDDLIEVIKSKEKICKYLDMPIQHSNDSILKLMNRRTRREALTQLINKLRSQMPDIVLRTSLIVGFPGEEDKHYQDLKAFVEEMQFDKLGVFAYSKEEGTPAALLPDQVDEDIKEVRRSEIMEIQQKISLDNNQAKVGREMEVLVEEVMVKGKEYMGRTRGDAPEIDGLVYLQSSRTIEVGEIVKVKISGALEYDLMGDVIDEFSK
ncbi:30S ribosomal protein S12 methylthiotransferase RimO [Alkaliphilus peptidifermentans]|uniref:Ribosomal protein uS12 methylthiotransferase RimO n=1 Tax=Alkaliphilus peptidifermentans DSM 18978 TaxID=1120976 RepID=A0A1G5DAT9_9FIRM|nr:30S ribosomal protein S12 methylthiotransferase RimO [Alkaliphilus peptidifermentans]SCY11959.1 SSU ribosomal protein S12P methylthiotransferase [Alkaliphilus peptidifermentans DSM 18978]